MKITLLQITLSLAMAVMPAAQPQAGEKTAQVAKPSACAREQFRGKNARARMQGCLDELSKQEQAREAQGREEIEAMRLALREQCAQDPRSCDARRAQLVEQLQATWRDQAGEGHASH